MTRFRTSEDDWVTLEGVIDATSSKAVLFNGVNFDQPEWVPRSQMEIVEEATRPGDLTTIRVKAWLAAKHGWE